MQGYLVKTVNQFHLEPIVRTFREAVNSDPKSKIQFFLFAKTPDAHMGIWSF